MLRAGWSVTPRTGVDGVLGQGKETAKILTVEAKTVKTKNYNSLTV